MANTKSALKRIRQTKTRTERNRTVSSRLKTLRKKTLAAAEAGNADDAKASFREFSSTVDRACKNGLIHKNKAANLKSKTNAVVKAASA